MDSAQISIVSKIVSGVTRGDKGSGPGARQGNNYKKNVKCVFAGFSLVAFRTVFRVVLVVEAQIKNGTSQLGSHFWRLSLGSSYTSAKAMCDRE